MDIEGRCYEWLTVEEIFPRLIDIRRWIILVAGVDVVVKDLRIIFNKVLYRSFLLIDISCRFADDGNTYSTKVEHSMVD